MQVNFARVNKRLFVLLVVLFAALVPGAAVSEYKDPIDLPALKVPSAKSNLLLDVTSAGSRLVAVGERGHVLYSDDDGSTWVQADVSTRTQLNGVDFVNDRIGWAVGEDQVILRTTDRGETWQTQTDGRDAEVKGPLLDVHFLGERRGLAVGVFNRIFLSSNGGRTWQRWENRIENPLEWHLFAIDSVGPRVYIASEKGLVFKSSDKGERFEALQTPHGGTFHGILARPGEDGLDRLIAFGVGGVVFSSKDSGESWSRIPTNIDTGLSGGTWLPDGSALLVGAAGRVIHLNSDLSNSSNEATRAGQPLSDVLLVDRKDSVMVGLNGVSSYSISHFQTRRSPDAN